MMPSFIQKSALFSGVMCTPKVGLKI